MSLLDHLEEETITLIRESCFFFKRPVILFSGGKDSTVLIHLARKAFYPQKMPLTILHVDTGHNFPEALIFRDELIRKNHLTLSVALVEDSIKKGRVVDNPISRNQLQSVTLMDFIHQHEIDCCIGGARRDEEKARAKERLFSIRNSEGKWKAENQSPEPWNIVYPQMDHEGHYRVFPLSNWCELDIWEYIQREQIELPSLYFAHEREVFTRNGQLYAYHEVNQPKDYEQPFKETVRFRTVGDLTCTAAMKSTAGSMKEIIEELKMIKTSERGSRIDDKVSTFAMEERKKEGYF